MQDGERHLTKEEAEQLDEKIFENALELKENVFDYYEDKEYIKPERKKTKVKLKITNVEKYKYKE